MINVVCAVIRDSAGEFLVCRRPVGKALAGKWEFPGGKVEPGEDPEVALRREISEELRCEIEVGIPLPVVEHHYVGSPIRLLPYLCCITTGKPKAVEHSEIRWVKQAECPLLDWADADVPIWQALVAD